MITQSDIALATERIAALPHKRLGRVELFKAILSEFLAITGSKDGFVGEVPRDENGLLYIRAFAATELAWEASLGAPDEAELQAGLELHQMSTPWGRVLKSGKALVLNEDTQVTKNFLGIPLKIQGRWEGIIALANAENPYPLEWSTHLLPMVVAATLVILQERDVRRVAESEKRLIEKVRRTEQALKVAHAGVLEWEVVTDVLHCDDGICDLLAIDKKDRELSLDAWLEFLSPKDRPDIHKRFKALVDPNNSKSTGDRMELEFRVVKAAVPAGSSGGSLTSSIRSTLMVERDPRGKALKIRGLCWDISRQKEVESQLADNRTRMTSASRLSSLGEMAGGVAHEINNPLAIIQANAMTLKELMFEGQSPEVLARFIDKIINTASRIARIVKGLRTFSRNADNDPFAAITIQEMVDSTLDFCREKLSASGIEIKTHVPAGLSAVCRGVQISQALLNLINNAADAIEGLEPRWVQIDAKEIDSPDGVEMVEISVTDCGSGITPEIADKIMQPFFTTKEIGKGAGLGLSVAKGIAESHKGELLLDRESPNTRFVIQIPRRPAAAAGSSHSSAPPPAVPPAQNAA